jgi:hypothetical protein
LEVGWKLTAIGGAKQIAWLRDRFADKTAQSD